MVPIVLTIEFDPKHELPPMDLILPVGLYKTSDDLVLGLNNGRLASTHDSRGFIQIGCTDEKSDHFKKGIGRIIISTTGPMIESIATKSRQGAAMLGMVPGKLLLSPNGERRHTSFHSMAFPFKPILDYHGGIKICIDELDDPKENKDNVYYHFQASPGYDVVSHSKANDIVFEMTRSGWKRITVTNLDDEVINLEGKEWEMILKREGDRKEEGKEKRKKENDEDDESD